MTKLNQDAEPSAIAPVRVQPVVRAMSDEELFAAIREQVNKARNHTHGHDREMTKAIGEEMVRRGWRNGPNAEVSDSRR